MLIWLLVALKSLLGKGFRQKHVLVREKMPQTVVWQAFPHDLGLDSIV
jgi:hypothetical protein